MHWTDNKTKEEIRQIMSKHGKSSAKKKNEIYKRYKEIKAKWSKLSKKEKELVAFGLFNS